MATNTRTIESTTVNVKYWRLAKEELLNSAGDARRAAAERLEEIAHAELENARNTIPLVEFDSRLGYEPSMEYMCDREHIEWKIAVTEKVINEELKEYLI